MKFYKLRNYLFKEDTKDNGAVNDTDKEEIDIADERSEEDKIADKLNEYAELAINQFQKLIDTKENIILQKIQNSGIDEMLEDFIIQKFIPSFESSKDKMFLSANIDDFVSSLAEKIQTKIIKDIEDGAAIGKIDDNIEDNTEDNTEDDNIEDNTEDNTEDENNLDKK